MVEIFWFRSASSSGLQKKSGKKAQNITSGSSLRAVLVRSHFPCLCSLCKQNLLFLNLHPGHNWVASFLKNTHAGRKKNSTSNTCNHQHNLHLFGFIIFFPVLGQILWLAFHSYSASLIFTFTLKRFISHFLQRIILEYQTSLSDICTCPTCLQRSPRCRPKTRYQKYPSGLSFILLPQRPSLDHGLALLTPVGQVGKADGGVRGTWGEIRSLCGMLPAET